MFTQDPYQYKLEWGICGLIRAVERNEIIVLVDCLSFTTAVTVAVYHGAIIIPCSKDDDRELIARKHNAEVAVTRQDVPEKGNYSLSPQTFLNINKLAKVVLPSLNGSTCSRSAIDAPLVIAGSLINAQAVASYVETEMQKKGTAVTAVACGEREKGDESKADLRFAIEDYLGAGAILSYLTGSKSPEAELCCSS